MIILITSYITKNSNENVMKSIAKFLVVLCFIGSLSVAAERPNVIIVMTDDQGYPNLKAKRVSP